MAHIASNFCLDTRRQLIPYANLVKISVCRVIDKILDARNASLHIHAQKFTFHFRLFSSVPSGHEIHAIPILLMKKSALKVFNVGVMLQIYFQ